MNLTSSTPRFTALRNAAPSSVTAAEAAWQQAVCPANAPRRRWFNRSSGFWLGRALLGVGGCILGGCVPYRHPVALIVSAPWWGIYLGCLGATTGALLGLWAEQSRGAGGGDVLPCSRMGMAPVRQVSEKFLYRDHCAASFSDCFAATSEQPK